MRSPARTPVLPADIWQNASSDAYDTMAWIAKQPWSNGDVVMTGASADGEAALTTIESNPPWLKKMFIIFACAPAWKAACMYTRV